MKCNLKKNIDYLRVSITDNCNLKCIYCTSNNDIFQSHEKIDFDQFFSIIDVLLKGGIKKIRITGGEPLLEKNSIKIIKKLSLHPLSPDLFLTTNLHVPSEIVEELNDLNIKGINISLDTLNKKVYQEITQFGDLNLVLKNFRLLKHNNVKINTVVLKGINDKEIEKLVQFSIDSGYIIRFIECMQNLRSNRDYYISNEYIIQSLIEKNIINSKTEKIISGTAAVYYTLEKYHEKEIGFISSVSRKFCNNCNRLRLTSDGRLHLCLFNRISIPFDEYKDKNFNNDDFIKYINNILIHKKEDTGMPYYFSMRSMGG